MKKFLLCLFSLSLTLSSISAFAENISAEAKKEWMDEVKAQIIFYNELKICVKKTENADALNMCFANMIRNNPHIISESSQLNKEIKKYGK